MTREFSSGLKGKLRWEEKKRRRKIILQSLNKDSLKVLFAQGEKRQTSFVDGRPDG